METLIRSDLKCPEPIPHVCEFLQIRRNQRICRKILILIRNKFFHIGIQGRILGDNKKILIVHGPNLKRFQAFNNFLRKKFEYESEVCPWSLQNSIINIRNFSTIILGNIKRFRTFNHYCVKNLNMSYRFVLGRCRIQYYSFSNFAKTILGNIKRFRAFNDLCEKNLNMIYRFVLGLCRIPLLIFEILRKQFWGT